MHEKQDTAQSIDTAEHQAAPRRRWYHKVPVSFPMCLLATFCATWQLNAYVQTYPRSPALDMWVMSMLLFSAGVASGANIRGRASK